MSRKPPPEETLRALERLVAEEADAPAFGIQEKSDAELDAGLRDLGLDPEAERAFAEDLAQRVVASRGTTSEPASTQSSDQDRARSRRAPEPTHRWFDLSLAAAIAALLGSGILSASGAFGPEAVGHGHDDARADEAHHLRDEAAALAKEEHWKESLEKLDEAKKIDPAGDKDESTERLRHLDQEKAGSPTHP